MGRRHLEYVARYEARLHYDALVRDNELIRLGLDERAEEEREDAAELNPYLPMVVSLVDYLLVSREVVVDVRTHDDVCF